MQSFPLQLRHASGQIMDLVPDRVLVSLSSPQASAGTLKKLGLVPDTTPPVHAGASQPRTSRPMERINSTGDRQFARTASGKPFDPTAVSKTSAKEVNWIGPVYRLAVGDHSELLTPLPHVILVKARSGTDTGALNKALAGLGLVEVKEKSRYLGAYSYYELTDPLNESALDVIDRVWKGCDDSVEDLRFETMPYVVPTAYVPNDGLYPNQWNMEQIEAGGSGHTGWNMERGDPDVIICVLDEGCDLGHPDLTFVHDGINLGTMLPTGAPTGNHGTPCAGIAAADIGNSEGVAGVAGDCRILPVAFEFWTDVEVAAGITYAADEGANVISMSFGWDAWDPAIIDPAIQYAFDNNLVMCAATHNHDTLNGVTYPATNDLVMGIGASDQIDNRKDPSSPDGEWWWGSNYGPEVSVVAPGVLCPTTDRQGTAGYNSAAGSAGDYVMDFNGTSAATPHVAGLAALLFSAKPGITNTKVRNCIEKTADKVGVVPYTTVTGYPNGTWNNEMGYGRINVHEALHCATKTILDDIKLILFDKKFWIDKSWKIEFPFDKRLAPKEKEKIDEVKGLVDYENPIQFDPSIFVQLEQRLDRLEKALETGTGRSFITPRERPVVGNATARSAHRYKTDEG